jgi:hypothetical protein
LTFAFQMIAPEGRSLMLLPAMALHQPPLAIHQPW